MGSITDVTRSIVSVALSLKARSNGGRRTSHEAFEQSRSTLFRILSSTMYPTTCADSKTKILTLCLYARHSTLWTGPPGASETSHSLLPSQTRHHNGCADASYPAKQPTWNLSMFVSLFSSPISPSFSTAITSLQAFVIWGHF
jgi:hypothetical protein